jgi:hypothetical protein
MWKENKKWNQFYWPPEVNDLQDSPKNRKGAWVWIWLINISYPHLIIKEKQWEGYDWSMTNNTTIYANFRKEPTRR